MRILLAEDDEFLASGIALALSDSGYAIDEVRTGQEADSAITNTAYDLVILDLGLPTLDGLEVLTRARARGQALPILILTARDDVRDRVTGLDAGANDYLTKPFHLEELEARIRALLRKDRWENKTTVTYGPLTFDTSDRVATLQDKPLDLSARELAVLEILMQKAGRTVSKEHITDHLSTWESEVTFNAIEITIHRLRKKIGEAGVNIRTLRGLGYLLETTG
ncbi:MAG: response regulator [Candidatus Obscuribacterales bacterium]|nr:response regulator [Candidatus Obscuribacterales bacterium]